jgi:putative DNA primase/helicase
MRTASTSKPTALAVDPDGIPAELKERRQWVLWRYTWKDEDQKWDKPPYQCNGRFASSTDPSTWGSFEEVWAVYKQGGWDGIGIMIADGLVFIDLDGCRNPQTGSIRPWSSKLRAKFRRSVPHPIEIIAKTQTFTEVSPSGSGFHLFAIGDLPEDGRKIGGKGNGCPDGLEMYKANRYSTITGQRIESSPATIDNCNGKLTELWATVFGD